MTYSLATHCLLGLGVKQVDELGRLSNIQARASATLHTRGNSSTESLTEKERCQSVIPFMELGHPWQSDVTLDHSFKLVIIAVLDE